MKKAFAPAFLYSPEGEILKNALLITDETGKVLEIKRDCTLDSGDIQLVKLPGLLCPAFVNAHCHLELSWMDEKIPNPHDLDDFVRHVQIEKKLKPKHFKQLLEEADRQMFDNGIAVCGDISNTADSFFVKRNSAIHYHSFIEVFGSHPMEAEKHFNRALQLFSQYIEKVSDCCSISPHAGYSVSKQLLRLIQKHAESNQKCISIHHQETEEENLFFEKASGPVMQRLKEFGIPIDHLKAEGKRPAVALTELLPNRQTILFVHNRVSTEVDIQWILEHFQNPGFCLCPQSNLRISKALPDIPMLERCGAQICLGTDSLASADELSILKEMQIIQQNFPEITPEKLLQWATKNGAEILGLQNRYGSFTAGSRLGIIHINHFDGEVFSKEARVQRIF